MYNSKNMDRSPLNEESAKTRKGKKCEQNMIKRSERAIIMAKTYKGNWLDS